MKTQLEYFQIKTQSYDWVFYYTNDISCLRLTKELGLNFRLRFLSISDNR